MTLFFDDTIAALASPAGGGGRGIIRLSGSDVRAPLVGIFQAANPERWESARVAERHAGAIRLPDLSVRIEAAAYLWPTRRSYTGEPMVELHLPGSPPLLEAVLSALHERGARPARPGEFTLRAFLGGRIDLVQAEAVLGVIDAHDHRELETALGQLAGGLSGKLAEVRRDLIDLLADFESGLDFIDEDIEFVARPELTKRVDEARAVVAHLLEQSSQRMRFAAMQCVVIAGLPNAGKSTLFNALVGREAALVSPLRGTTRDWLSAELDWQEHEYEAKLVIELIDTAGWETLEDDSEETGIMAAAEALRAAQFERADLIVWCTAADLDDRAARMDEEFVARLRFENRPLLQVRTRIDLADANRTERERSHAPASDSSSSETDGLRTGILRVSAPAGIGLSELRAAIVERLSDARSGGRELVGMTASRSRESLATAVAALDRARIAANEGLGEEILAIELRDALEHLGRILGSVYTDDILDRVFSKFCIGK